MYTREMSTEEKIDLIKKIIIASIIIFLMTYFVVEIEITAPFDYKAHADWAEALNIKNFGEYFSNNISYPVWHLAVKIFGSAFHIDIYRAASIITALFNVFTFSSVLFVWTVCHNTKIKINNYIFWAVCLLVVNPIYATWFSYQYYPSHQLPNVWHNPTHIAVRGFAVLAFGLIILLLDRKDKTKNTFLYIALSISALLSALAKPSFLQGLLPGLALFLILRLIIENKKYHLNFYVKLFISFLPAIGLLLFQTFATFFNTEFARTELHIGIGWGKYLYTVTPFLFRSFVVSFIFPLFVLFYNLKTLIKKEEIQLMVCYEAMAWLEAVLLYEEGEAFGYGDFTWGYLMSSFIVWMTMIYYFIQNLYTMENEKTIKKRILIFVGIPLFIIHFIFGIVYWYNLFTGKMLY